MKLKCVVCGATEEADLTLDLIRLAARGWDTDPQTCPEHPAARVATQDEAAFSEYLERMKARPAALPRNGLPVTREGNA